MIYLTVKKIPDGENAVGLYQKALALYAPSQNNAQYVEKLSMRADGSAKESLFALILLSTLVERAGRSVKGLELCRNANGKPYFENSDLKFSISHSGGYVAVALSDDGDIGIDIETADVSEEKARKLAKRFFTEDEQCAVRDDTDAFLKLWSKKEATAKYLGTSLTQIIQNDRSDQADAVYNEMKFQTVTANDVAVTVCAGCGASTDVTVF